MTSVEQPSATFRPSALPGGSLIPGTGHLPFTSDLLAALKPSLLVQLGVASGDSYFAVCQFIHSSGQLCSAYGVDTWTGSDYERVARYHNEHFHTFSHLLQAKYDKAITEFKDESIGLLVLDLIEPYDALKHIFELWLAKVHSGGVILIHNLSTRGGAQLWKELSSRYPSFSFRNNKGLGVLAKSSRTGKVGDFLSNLFHSSSEEQKRLRRHYSDRVESAPLPEPLTVHSLFQVFRLEDNEYETSSDWTQLLPANTWMNIRLNLPRGLGDGPLRLQLTDRAAVVDIAALSLRKEDGHSAWTWNHKNENESEQIQTAGNATRMPEEEFFRVFAVAAGPHVHLPELTGTPFDQPLELEIRLRIDLELAALKELAQQQLPIPSSVSTSSLESAVTKAKVDSARYLAQSRIEYDSRIRQITAESDSRAEAARAELEALRSELEAVRVDHQHHLSQQLALLAEERRAHQVTTLERENLEAAHPRLLQEISIAQGNVEELKVEVERLTGELSSMEFDVAELRKLNSQLAATLESERHARANMQESGSWQLTKPLRAVGDLFGPRKKY